MQDNFPGFYSPSEKELAALWREAVFVLDASVLLKLYEVPETTRQETFAAFRKLGKRLWVPHQAALEYQRNRARTIGMARNRVSDALEPMAAALQSFMKAATAIKLGERGYADAAKRLEDINAGGDEVIAAARAAIANHVDLSGDDPIRRELDTLLAGQVGEPPTPEKIEEWNKDAQRRYSHRMGPGHLDQDKMKNPTYMLDGLVFDKRYGDLYLWQQTIEHSRAPEVRHVVMITNDSKADWWKVTDYGVAGPLPELCSEIRKEANLSGFWMYDLEGFLREAGLRLDVNVSKTTISDMAIPQDFNRYLAEAVSLATKHNVESPGLDWILDEDTNRLTYKAREQRAVRRLGGKLRSRGYNVLEKTLIAVGYKMEEDQTSIGVAILEEHLDLQPILSVIRSEIEAMVSLVSPQRVDVYIFSSRSHRAGDASNKVDWLSDELLRAGLGGLQLTVNYCADDDVLLARTTLS